MRISDIKQFANGQALVKINGIDHYICYTSLESVEKNVCRKCHKLLIFSEKEIIKITKIIDGTTKAELPTTLPYWDQIAWLFKQNINQMTEQNICWECLESSKKFIKPQS